VVTDDGESSQNLAKSIAAAITPPLFDGYSVSVMKADAFYGTDILPAHAFFFGCDAPSPSSFDYAKLLFERINLARRPCGIFSSNPKALKYLARTISPSGASIGRPLLAKADAPDAAKLGEWIKGVLEGGSR